MKIPTFGSPPTPGVRYIRRPGVYAILPLENRVLLTFQSGIHQEFQLPGGGIDPGEHPIQALHREVLEETGWSIGRPRLFRRFRRFTYMPEYRMFAEKLCSIFIARPMMPQSDPLESEHTADWQEMETACGLLANPGDCQALRDFAGL